MTWTRRNLPSSFAIRDKNKHVDRTEIFCGISEFRIGKSLISITFCNQSVFLINVNVTRHSCVKSHEVRLNTNVTAEKSKCKLKYLSAAEVTDMYAWRRSCCYVSQMWLTPETSTAGTKICTSCIQSTFIAMIFHNFSSIVLFHSF